MPTFPHLPRSQVSHQHAFCFHCIDARTFCFTFVSVSVCVCVCLCLCVCLCQTNLHMRVARQTPPNRQKLCTFYSAISRRGSAAGRSATLEPSARRFVSACEVRITRSQQGSPSSDSMRDALSICCHGSHQITQQFGALAAQSSISLEDQRSHGHSMALRFLRFPSNCSHSWFRRAFVVTFCMRTSPADVYPELLQDTREPGGPHLT